MIESAGATELLQKEAAKLGVKVEVVEPKPGTGTVTILAKRPAEDTLEDDDGSGAVE